MSTLNQSPPSQGPLTREMLQLLVPGTTHVLERNGKEAYVFLDSDGSAHMLLEDGEARSGRWRPCDGGYATEWESGHKGVWTLRHSSRGITYVSGDGSQCLEMLGILFGNPKRLPR